MGSNNANAPEKRPASGQTLLMCVLGIYSTYFIYGILQEKVYKSPYDGEFFKYSFFLLLCQCFVNGSAAKIVDIIRPDPVSSAPATDFFKISISYCGAMLASNLALAYVSYPTQILGKSIKMIPVMLMRIVINGKSYSWKEYLNVILMTIGVWQFMASSKKGGEMNATGLGAGLLLASLAMDAYTGPTQERVTKQYKLTANQMQININMYSAMMLTVALLITGEMYEALAFVQAHPAVIQDILIFSLCSAVGQKIILFVVFNYDSLTVSIITTTRKFFTILISYLWFGNMPSQNQFFGIVLVFAGLSHDIYLKNVARQKKTADFEAAKKKT